jgi:TP901-1 family phage major tail protein
MTAQQGALVLIKVGDGATPETFVTLGGLRTSNLVLNNHAWDTTTIESGNWRQLLANAGISAISISGSGLFTDALSEEQVRGYAFSRSVNNYRFIFANGDYLQGVFFITDYQRGGDYDSEEIYAITLESAGDVAFTQA